jgi:hypothetical protein
VLAVLLFRHILAKLAFRREQPPVYNLESLIVLRIGQRFLPQTFLR